MENSVKSHVRSLTEKAHQQQLAQIAALSDAERAGAGTPERWSAKDHLAHTMYWKERTAERLAAAARGDSPTDTGDDFLQINEENFEHHQARPWADVLADDARIHAALLAGLDALSDDDLTDPARFPWNDGQPLLTSALGSVGHVQEHIAQFLSDRGDLEGATAVQEEFVQAVTGSALPSIAHAFALYNLACFYAKTERPARAVDLLSQALRLRPEFTEWSKEDPDFASLHAEPAYQALYR